MSDPFDPIFYVGPADPAAPPARPAPPARNWLHRFRAMIAIVCWMYVILMAAVWLVLRLEGDRWWVATMLVYGPKWVWALPLIPLLPVVLIGRRRSLGALLLGTLLLAFPVMNLRLPVGRFTTARATGPSIRVLTFNTHETAVDVQGLRAFLATARPDVVLLQEFPTGAVTTLFADGPWHTVMEGSYCVASRYPVRLVGLTGPHRWPRVAAGVQFEIDSPDGVIPVLNVHLVSPHVAFHATLHHDPKGPATIQQNSADRLAESREIRYLARAIGPGVVIAGDFNLPTDSRTYRESFASFNNAFDKAGLGFGWTYDVRLTTTRIDHVLTGDHWQCKRSWVGPRLGSPHHPLLADLEWIGGPLAPPRPEPPAVVAAAPAPDPAAALGPTVQSPAAVVRPSPAVAAPPVASASPVESPPRVPVPPPRPPAASSAVTIAIREHRLVAGMTMDQAKEALAGWDGPGEVQAELASGWKLHRWQKADERILAAFDGDGRLRSFQKR